MTGVLLIDKPAGPTSHDVVARLRRTSGERAIGHAGTLDPLATGLLVLVLGRATRLASFLTGHDKSYDAIIRLGVSTDTDDAEGRVIGRSDDRIVGRSEGGPSDIGPSDIEAALDTFRGAFEQVPPAHSAKKVRGVKAYTLARQKLAVALRPVPVTVRRLALLDYADGRVELQVTATAGFYVRALARDLGERLGCGAHLEALRRTASGPLRVDAAMPLADAERLGPEVAARLVSPADALPDLPAVGLTESGVRRAVHGNWLAPEHLATAGWASAAPSAGATRVRLLDADGRLVGLAEPRRGTLHPVVVLG